MPVILIVYDARKDEAYWLYIQSYFAKRKDFNLFTAGADVTVQMPSANGLTKAAIKKIARFRDRLREEWPKEWRLARPI